MKEIDLDGKIKLKKLQIKKFFRSLFHDFYSKLICLLIFFFVLVNIWIFLPDLFGYSPVFSYFTRKFALPMTYEMHGTIEHLDGEGNALNDLITIYIGGYQKHIETNTKYDFEFTSPQNDSFFVNIIYKDLHGREKLYTKKVSFPDKGNEIWENFVINEQAV